jgi:hypothetical protein
MFVVVERSSAIKGRVTRGDYDFQPAHDHQGGYRTKRHRRLVGIGSVREYTRLALWRDTHRDWRRQVSLPFVDSGTGPEVKG